MRKIKRICVYNNYTNPNITELGAAVDLLCSCADFAAKSRVPPAYQACVNIISEVQPTVFWRAI